jgi:predicted nucleic acid-binding protein
VTSCVLVDANVLVYADDLGEPEKAGRSNAWLDALWASHRGRVSTQVLNEYYVTVTRKLTRALTPGDARANVRRYQLWQPWQLDHLTVETAWGIEARFNVHYWDALVLAAAQHSGCRYVLTEDLQHGQQIGALTIVNPFAVQPQEVLSSDA